MLACSTLSVVTASRVAATLALPQNADTSFHARAWLTSTSCAAGEQYAYTSMLAVSLSARHAKQRFHSLALQLHPDKNSGEHAELAHVAFQEVVAAFEVLGTPDKRAAFDEAAGGGGSFADFGARWENREFEWDSDMYKGAQFITTVRRRRWTRLDLT